MPSDEGGVYVGPGEGRSFRFGPSHLQVKVGPDAALSFGIFHSSFPTGAGMPFLHLHHSYDETFYVIEGEVEFQLGARRVLASTGGTVVVPRGVAHCFRNVGASDASWIVATAPAAAITMIEELATVPPADFDRFAEVLEQHDSELLERYPHWNPPVATESGHPGIAS
jgi:mannose-6-phosphate isomerase-like protein (cupin superfamily)